MNSLVYLQFYNKKNAEKLNAIPGFAELLKGHMNDRERVEIYVDKIRSAGSMLLSIINHVLEMARIESGKTTLNANVANINDIELMLSTIGKYIVKKCSFE